MPSASPAQVAVFTACANTPPPKNATISTSIATVDSALISRAEAVTVDQAMQGKIPGAQIRIVSGATSPIIRSGIQPPRREYTGSRA